MINETGKNLEEAVNVLAKVDGHLDGVFKIEGKTRKQWRNQLRVDFPEDEITFADLIKLGAKIANNYQIAARHRDHQTLTIDTLSRTRFDTYNREYKAILDDYIEKTGKALAQKSCEVKANAAVRELDSAIGTVKTIRDFWAKTCDTLVEARKSLEVVAHALSGDARIGRDFVVKLPR